MEAKELADAIRAAVDGHRADSGYVMLMKLADRLSPVEAYPKYAVWADYNGTFDVAYWRWDSPTKARGYHRSGESYTPIPGLGMSLKIYVTEAEAKAHVRPEPPKGKKLTGEFRVPKRGEHYVHHTGCYDVWRHDDGPPAMGPDFNGGKRWILEDDDTCPTCHGKGTV